MKHEEQQMKTTSTGFLVGLAACVCLGACASAAAQPGRQRLGGSSEDIGPQYMRGAFERNAPDIGEPMPDLAVYDEAGKELRLREVLSGRHSVLILGCLT